jgi:hypothetical protein
VAEDKSGCLGRLKEGHIIRVGRVVFPPPRALRSKYSDFLPICIDVFTDAELFVHRSNHDRRIDIGLHKRKALVAIHCHNLLGWQIRIVVQVEDPKTHLNALGGYWAIHDAAVIVRFARLQRVKASATRHFRAEVPLTVVIEAARPRQLQLKRAFMTRLDVKGAQAAVGLAASTSYTVPSIRVLHVSGPVREDQVETIVRHIANGVRFAIL